MSTSSPFQSPATVQSLTRWDEDPALYLFTSLTAGSSHIITATARIGTILKAAQIPYVAVDTATDESARKLWGRRAKGKKLPGLVKEGFVIADLEEVEEWNEFGELEDNIGPVPDPSTTSTTAGTGKPLKTTTSSSFAGTMAAATTSKSQSSSEVPAAKTATSISGSSMKLPIRQLANEVAQKATSKNTPVVSATSTATTKEKDSISGDSDGAAIKESNPKSDEKFEERSETKAESTPEVNAITGMASKPNPSNTTTEGSPAIEDETKNTTETSNASKTIPSKPGDDHESSSAPKSELTQGAAAERSEEEVKSKQSSTNEGDEATTPSNSEKAQSDLKRDVAEAEKSAGSEETKSGSDKVSKDGDRDSEKKKEERKKEEEEEEERVIEKENKAKVEAEAMVKGGDEDETIRPQLQDAKNSEAAGVSNMD